MDEIRLTVQEPEPINLKTEQIATGPYYLPAVSDEGVISFTNNGGLPNPESRSIKGPQGDTGKQGPAGVDGVSPTIGVTDITGGHQVTITDADGVHSFDVMNGADAPAPDLTPYAKNAMIDTVQASAVATSNYVVGDTFILSDKLYKVDTAIATGEQIVPGAGGNCHETTVEAEIQAAKSSVKSVSAGGQSLTPDQNGNVNIPKADYTNFGTIRVSGPNWTGNEPLGVALRVPFSGQPEMLSVVECSKTDIAQRGENASIKPLRHVLIASNYDYAVKCAMTDGVGAAWTDAERLGALLRMGCTVDENGYVKWTAQPAAE